MSSDQEHQRPANGATRHTNLSGFGVMPQYLGEWRTYPCNGRRVVGQKPKRNNLTERSLLWALGVILLLWIFAALRACGVTEIIRRLYS